MSSTYQISPPVSGFGQLRLFWREKSQNTVIYAGPKCLLAVRLKIEINRLPLVTIKLRSLKMSSEIGGNKAPCDANLSAQIPLATSAVYGVGEHSAKKKGKTKEKFRK